MTTRVLIVDDEETLAFLLGQSLELCLPDCEAKVVHSGEEALNSLARASYDLIIADVHMPGELCGLDLIREVRCLDAGVRVILMTGYGSALLQAKGAALGINHYVDKPFDINQLIEVAGRLLAGKEEAGS